MMPSITVNPGTMGESIEVYIQWMDEDCVDHEIAIDVAILNQDKPRVLRLNIAEKYVLTATEEEDLSLDQTPYSSIGSHGEPRQIIFKTSEDEYGNWDAFPEDAELFKFAQGQGGEKEEAIADLARELSTLFSTVSEFFPGSNRPEFELVEADPPPPHPPAPWDDRSKSAPNEIPAPTDEQLTTTNFRDDAPYWLRSGRHG